MSNRILTLKQIAARLGVEGRANKVVKRHLDALSEQRPHARFRLFRRGLLWVTTDEDLRRLLPELYTGEDDESLRATVEKQALELRETRKRVERLENLVWRQSSQKGAA